MPATDCERPTRPLGVVVGANLRRLRVQHRMTQHEMARHLQQRGLTWTRSQVAAIEAGKRASIGLGPVAVLASALGVRLTELFKAT